LPHFQKEDDGRGAAQREQRAQEGAPGARVVQHVQHVARHHDIHRQRRAQAALLPLTPLEAAHADGVTCPGVAELQQVCVGLRHAQRGAVAVRAKDLLGAQQRRGAGQQAQPRAELDLEAEARLH